MRGLGIDGRLEAIAGKPVAIQRTAGFSADMSSFFTAFQGRSFYVAWNLLTTTPPATNQRVAYTSVSAPSALFLQRTTSGGGMQAFAATNDVSSGVITISTAALKVGGNAFASVMADGMGLWTYRFLSGETASVTLTTPNAGFTQTPFTLNLQPAQSVVVPLIAVGYAAVHTADQQKMIMRKLLQMTIG